MFWTNISLELKNYDQKNDAKVDCGQISPQTPDGCCWTAITNLSVHCEVRTKEKQIYKTRWIKSNQIIQIIYHELKEKLCFSFNLVSKVKWIISYYQQLVIQFQTKYLFESKKRVDINAILILLCRLSYFVSVLYKSALRIQSE